MYRNVNDPRVATQAELEAFIADAIIDRQRQTWWSWAGVLAFLALLVAIAALVVGLVVSITADQKANDVQQKLKTLGACCVNNTGTLQSLALQLLGINSAVQDHSLLIQSQSTNIATFNTTLELDLESIALQLIDLSNANYDLSQQIGACCPP